MFLGCQQTVIHNHYYVINNSTNNLPGSTTNLHGNTAYIRTNTIHLHGNYNEGHHLRDVNNVNIGTGNTIVTATEEPSDQDSVVTMASLYQSLF